MAKYEVIRPWHGVKRGDVVELKQLHPALKANVRPIGGAAAKLDPATPEATTKRGRQPKAPDPATPEATTE